MNNHVGKKPRKLTSVLGQVIYIGLHRAGKSVRKVFQMMVIELRTVQRTIAPWKNDCELQSFSGNSGRTKTLNARDRRSLKRLVKANRRKSVQQLTSSMFNESSKKISARTMLRELNKMGLRSCVSTRKPEFDKLFDRVVYIYIYMYIGLCVDVCVCACIINIHDLLQ